MSGGRVRRYRGVRQRQWGSWVSEIRHSISKTRVWLGTFDTAKEAAKAYDEAARLMEGPSKAKTNFSSSSSSSSATTSLLSPAVRAKLQRCNCLATLQGGRVKTVPGSHNHAKRSAPPPPPSNPGHQLHHRRQPASAPLVCLRLDHSQEQLGVTWHSSSSSSSWFTTLPLPPTPTPPQQPRPAQLDLGLTSPPPAQHLNSIPTSSQPHHLGHLSNLSFSSVNSATAQSRQLTLVNTATSAPPLLPSPSASTADSLVLEQNAGHTTQLHAGSAANSIAAPMSATHTAVLSQLQQHGAAVNGQKDSFCGTAQQSATQNMYHYNTSCSASMEVGDPLDYCSTQSAGTPEHNFRDVSCTSGLQYNPQSDALSSLAWALWYLSEEEHIEQLAGVGSIASACASTSSSELEGNYNAQSLAASQEGAAVGGVPSLELSDQLHYYNSMCQEVYEQQLWL